MLLKHVWKARKTKMGVQCTFMAGQNKQEQMRDDIATAEIHQFSQASWDDSLKTNNMKEGQV